MWGADWFTSLSTENIEVDNFQNKFLNVPQLTENYGLPPSLEFLQETGSAWPWVKPWTLYSCDDTASRVLSPSSSCSDLKGASAGLRLPVEFPRRSGREEDTDTTEGFLLHFNTDGNSSTTGNSSVAGNSSCDIKEDGDQKLKSLNISTCFIEVLLVIKSSSVPECKPVVRLYITYILAVQPRSDFFFSGWFICVI